MVHRVEPCLDDLTLAAVSDMNLFESSYVLLKFRVFLCLYASRRGAWTWLSVRCELPVAALECCRIFILKRKTPKSPLEHGGALQCADDRALIMGREAKTLSPSKYGARIQRRGGISRSHLHLERLCRQGRPKAMVRPPVSSRYRLNQSPAVHQHSCLSQLPNTLLFLSASAAGACSCQIVTCIRLPLVKNFGNA